MIQEYIGKQTIVDTEFMLNMFAADKQKAVMAYKKFMNESNENEQASCLDYEEKHWVSDEDVIRIMAEKYRAKKDSFHSMERGEMDRILRELKAINGVTIRQLARLTGVSKFKVEKA